MSGPERLFRELDRSMVALDEGATMDAVSGLLAENVPPKELIDSLNQSMLTVTKMFQDGTYYMSGLLLANEIMRVAMERLIPLVLKSGGNEKRGLVLLGTMEGDIHELGKNMATWFLRADGFEVVDLGVDIPPRVFLREILQREPDVVGVSLLMAESVPLVRKLAGLVRDVYTDSPPPPLFVGCGFLKPNGDNPDYKEGEAQALLGVEHVVNDAFDTVELCRTLVKKRRRDQ
ncbi:MAG: cobalamin-dependent protein [Deltaproteobacteria bacterium]|jgi:methanogenic corrinoid protein MtbC1|nr:cobalamin-dependent protein [Deltaproteobacteria bacterium]